MIVYGQTGIPPIEVYQIGEIYFVKDGNHRVSVTRRLKIKSIPAIVTEIHTHIPLLPTDSPDALILKAEYAGFLHKTGLDEQRSDLKLELTAPGKYLELEELIAVHQYYMEQDLGREPSFEEAALDWYDSEFLPMAGMIENLGILQDFPGRTVADLVLWVSEHRRALESEMQGLIRPEDAARHLAEHFSSRPRRFFQRVAGAIKSRYFPQRLSSGPPAGRWRMERHLDQDRQNLFAGILVPFSGSAPFDPVLEQALILAGREQAHIQGLHIVPTGSLPEHAYEQHIHENFTSRCRQSGSDATVATVSGDISGLICERARWNDLIVMAAPGIREPELESEMLASYRLILQKCSRPLLLVPGRASQVTRLLLAYDSSPKSREALYLTMYMAGKWNVPVSVISVKAEGIHAGECLMEAGAYLEKYGIEPELIYKEGPAAEQIAKTAHSIGADLILTGSYTRLPSLAISAIDPLLAQVEVPVLICK